MCFPPYDEDYGFVTVEAFASRKPVITCTDSGGPAELVTDNVNGKVCAPRPETLAVALREVMDDAPTAERLGRAGLEKVSGMTWSKAVQRLADDVTTKPGILASALLGILLLGFALSVDFPKANGGGFKGDESTYYVLAHSLARDFDFQFERKDLIRVWEEYSGPNGIFLKRGKDIGISGSASFPFFRWQKREDPERETPSLRVEVLHLSARRRPVRVSVRHERIPGISRAPSRARSAGHLSLHPGGDEVELGVAAAGPRISRRLSHSRVFRVDGPRAVQFLSRPLRRVLLGLQGGRERASIRS